MNDLGKDKIGRLLLKMALPAITAQVINALYNVVDRMYIGHIEGIGTDALTGIGITFPIITLIMAFSSLICSGGAPRAAIYMGAKDNDKAENVLGNCMAVLVCISVILTTAILIFKEPILYAFGASDETIKYSVEYISIYALGTIFVQISIGLNAFINAQGNSLTGMLTILIGAVLNIALDPLFIFVFGMGVRGVAIATVISQAVSACWVLRFLFGRKSKLRVKKRDLILNPKIIKQIVSLGIAPFIMQTTGSLVNVCFNTSLQRYGGDIAVGAMTIIASIMQFINLPVSGVAQGAQTIISYNFGAGKINRVKKTFRLLLISILSFSAVFWLIMMLIPQAPISIFTSNKQLIEYTAWALRVYMAAALVMEIQTACQQTFIGLGQAKITMCLAILRKLILLVPLIFILPNFFADKAFAVFLAEPVADVIAVSTTATVFALNINKILNSRVPQD